MSRSKLIGGSGGACGERACMRTAPARARARPRHAATAPNRTPPALRLPTYSRWGRWPVSDVQQLVTILDQGFNRRSWHGPNLRGSIRGVSASLAAWRPAPARHNIWEITVHAAYWKYAVWRRLTGGRRGTFPLKGSN